MNKNKLNISYSQVQIIAIDTNKYACEFALYNAKALGLEERLTIVHATLEDNGEITVEENLSNDRKINFQEENFDFIVSNPPCIPTDQMPKWKKEQVTIIC